MTAHDDKIVYSTGVGRIKPAGERPRTPSGDGFIRVRREKQGRGGKTVTTIHDVPLADEQLKSLAGELKRLCGTGGTLKARVIEIQGDHRDKIVAALEQRGHRVKLAGG